MGYEIERKFTVKELPANLKDYPVEIMEQGYLCYSPVVRVRQENDKYYMTYKGKGTALSHEEYNLDLTKEGYRHLLSKSDGTIIRKKRYLIPIDGKGPTAGAPSEFIPMNLCVELDVFEEPFAPLIIAEIEFPDEESANRFPLLSWFAEDVTEDPNYHNAVLSKKTF